jgi:hypothetical protein
VPEETNGRNIYKTSQSAKWLKHLQSDLRVQMVDSNNNHFYIFEPVKLKDSQIVIPIFFHLQNEKTYAKCYQPIFKSNLEQSQVEIHISANISYHDDCLRTISVDEFSVPYPDIRLNSGSKLAECCGKKMIGEISLIGQLVKNPFKNNQTE